MCLADMGAEVLRIVSGSRPDMGDFLPPFVPGTDISAGSAFLGRNKRYITLNLRDPRALRIVHQLISEHGFDIITEQFRPGVMAKLSLAYENLKVIKPDIIYCSLTGYGQDGPMATRAGHDINYIARSVIASYSCKKEQGPSLMGMQIANVASGSNNANRHSSRCDLSESHRKGTVHRYLHDRWYDRLQYYFWRHLSGRWNRT
jgi:crotonobetainyl-CoA:carnitine CoA-transferase CaiB-like acyl-CoA transferase